MRQVWITKAGGPSVLQAREAPDPSPGSGEVRIRVKAAGVNFADVMARMGMYPDAPKLPCVVGYEVSGVIDAVGEGVVGLSIGDRVGALTRFGGYTDTICVPAPQVQRLSDAVSFEVGAAVPVNWLTAWLMIVRLGNLQPGERVLIHAAAGGVGQAAVQLARWRGASIIGTASASKHERLRASGVEHCVDYRTADFEQEVQKITGGKGVHLVIDAVGGASFKKSYRLLAPLGRLFMFGVSSFVPGQTLLQSAFAAATGFLSLPSFRPIPLMDDNRGVFGINMGHLWGETELLGKTMGEIYKGIDEGRFSPVIDETYPLDAAGKAHERLQARDNFGKVLLTT